MEEKKYPIKWEYKNYSYQIADTGDYDGYWEVTNGKDSLITKEDYEDIEKDLQAVVNLLNNTYANFTFDRGNEAALEAENRWLKDELEQHKSLPGPVWVKASIKPTELLKSYYCKLKSNIDGHLFGKLVLITLDGQWQTDWEIVEWLDETGTDTQNSEQIGEWDSNRLTGSVKERFKELEEKQHDWRSFYNGWIEGRADMLAQIKGLGKYKAQTP